MMPRRLRYEPVAKGFHTSAETEANRSRDRTQPEVLFRTTSHSSDARIHRACLATGSELK